MNELPASLGRYLSTSHAQDPGSTWSRTGITSRMPTRLEIPPGVLRTIQPERAAEQADEREIDAGPDNRPQHTGIGERAAVAVVGEEQLRAEERPEGRRDHGDEGDRPEHERLRSEDRDTSRDGRKRRADHPVEYSPVTNRTPRTPISSWRQVVALEGPGRRRVLGRQAAEVLPGVVPDHQTEDDQSQHGGEQHTQLDRRVRNLTHSDVRTRARLTSPSGRHGGGSAGSRTSSSWSSSCRNLRDSSR